MRIRLMLLGVSLVVFGLSNNAVAIPQLINYQGVLTDAGGTPIVVATNVQFTIFNQPISGDAQWSEAQVVTPDASGRFNVLLGSVTPIPDAVFNGDAYLNINVGIDPPLTPRQRIVSVGYAYRVSSVDGALGGEITSKVSIGPGHTNTGQNAFVAGEGCDATNGWATVSGGFSNSATGFVATVSGGQNNDATGTESVVGGGINNDADGSRATVAGGSSNSAGGSWTSVGGGNDNDASSEGSTIGGGRHNNARGPYATIAGGGGDLASDSNRAELGCAIGGGSSNLAVSLYATIAGGQSNTASGFVSTIGGGSSNLSSGDRSTVPGGSGNSAEGDFSFAVGKDCSTGPSGDYSVALGRRADASGAGCFVFADDLNEDFSVTAPFGGVFAVRATGGVGLGTGQPFGRALVVDNAYMTELTDMVRFDATEAITQSGRDILSITAASGSSTGLQFIECENGGDIEFRVHGDGDVTADGAFTGGGADFAEIVRVSSGARSVAAGDVMVIDPANSHSIVQSAQARSTLVAGIFSTRPGYIASERDWDQVAAESFGKRAGVDDESDVPHVPVVELAAQLDEVPLAVVGIVPCKVSTENGSISPGDLLVTSSTPGHAMRDDNPRAGTILGKALAPLASGSGVIKVLVTLH